ncbi:hypothetical protein H5T58_03580, partial [Candidatus Parcubacteria bacterium]|nr:hypothetical protein [Candidatus Parcubacteria bacterium]
MIFDRFRGEMFYHPGGPDPMDFWLQQWLECRGVYEATKTLANKINQEYTDPSQTEKPVGSDGRIEMGGWFKPIYGPQLECDQNEVKKQKDRIEEKNKNQNPDVQLGVRLERACFVGLNETLGEDLLILRASEWDDFFGGIDLILIDKKSGQILGVIDTVLVEVSPQEDKWDLGGRSPEKFCRNFSANLKGGKNIKYPLHLSEIDKKPRLVASPELKNIPSFTFSVSEEMLRNIERAFRNPQNEEEGKQIEEERKEVEKSFVKTFIETILFQIGVIPDEKTNTIYREVFSKESEELSKQVEQQYKGKPRKFIDDVYSKIYVHKQKDMEDHA